MNLVKALTSNVLRELPTEILVKRNAWSKGEKGLGIYCYLFLNKPSEKGIFANGRFSSYGT